MGGHASKPVLKNDLKAPLEVKADDGTWQVLYPGRSMDLAGRGGEVEARLREPPQVACCVPAKALRASRDLGEVTREGRRRDLQEAREAVEARERKDQAKRRLASAANEQALRAVTDETRVCIGCCEICLLFASPLVVLLFLALLTPGSDLAAGLLAGLGALPLGAWLGQWVAERAFDKDKVEANFGSQAPCYVAALWVLGLLVLLALAGMTVHHFLAGYWWTVFLIWPVPCCCSALAASAASEEGGEYEDLADARLEAKKNVLERGIVFKGAVIPEPGRKCICSWPGKYEGAWDRMVSAAKGGAVSAAVVFRTALRSSASTAKFHQVTK
ncbi:unnamed protein product [Symbiodinium natans]|uniref:Uncharacterized protein n=1 Tax=Symbiodinium natans TaxID=878477 RepID=A0A812S2S9_9DINO|nr:unnamed protein product [Symbiodinium natans]